MIYGRLYSALLSKVINKVSDLYKINPQKKP